ncbi:MAG: hypothetical protein AAF497_10155, partial [Planctomycetota bacterium]
KTAFVPLKSLMIGAGALAFAGIASAQDVPTAAFTKPVGYHTEEIKPGFNVVGVNLVGAPLVSSAITGAAGATLSYSQVDLGAAIGDGDYTIEFDNGAWSPIASADGNDVTTTNDISASVAAGASYTIRKVKTVEELFGSVDDTGLTVGADATSSDIVWVPDGAGGFTKLYPTTGDGFFLTAGWRDVAGADADNAAFPIHFTKGLLVERVGEGNVDVVFTGHVKTTPTTVDVSDAFTYLSRIYPSGSTFANSGLYQEDGSGVRDGASADEAENIWLPGEPGAFAKYYYTKGDGFFLTESWKDVALGDANQNDTELTSAYIIERKGDAYSMTVTPPEFYGDL